MMRPSISAVLIGDGPPSLNLIESLSNSPLVEGIVLAGASPDSLTNLPEGTRIKVRVLDAGTAGSIVPRIVTEAATDYMLWILPGHDVTLGQRSLERMLQAANDSGAGIVYSDFKDKIGVETADHPLIDYQLGSLRDNFDFGAVLLISVSKAAAAVKAHGEIDPGFTWGHLYDLRLKISIDSELLRIPEPLYTRVPQDRRVSGERQFDYIDPRQREYQLEMETVATAHLKRIGVYLKPEFLAVPRSDQRFPVRASIVIPVRNRVRTISDAIRSALSQQAPFDFNVIVVDNHSTDGTTETIADLAGKHQNLIHMTPSRLDLGIGGCWNQAIYSSQCGEYAIQLDSDDLYKDNQTLQKIVAKFEEGNYAMVIGTYTIVNFDLEEIPPGLIDHREWTRDNGRNNALRISGLGAPRAFFVPVLRRFGFPNTSYGEDYATALRISRDYEIGRIYESLYFARRWEGNSDAALSITTANRYDAYKDRLRSIEILARRRLNQRELG